jgi:hypothetical protein
MNQQNSQLLLCTTKKEVLQSTSLYSLIHNLIQDDGSPIFRIQNILLLHTTQCLCAKAQERQISALGHNCFIRCSPFDWRIKCHKVRSQDLGILHIDWPSHMTWYLCPMLCALLLGFGWGNTWTPCLISNFRLIEDSSN